MATIMVITEIIMVMATDHNKNTIIPIVIAIAAAFLFMSLSSYMTSALTTKEITYNQFIALLEQDKVDTVVI